MNATQQKNGKAAPKPNYPIQREDLSHYVFGKVQPQAIPLEEAVIGAMMLNRDIYDIVSDFLRPETFYVEAHQLTYAAIQELHAVSAPVDLLTVTEQLRKNGNLEKIGGGYYLVELSHRVASSANAEYHSRILQQKHIARCIIEICTRAIKDAYEETTDVFLMFDQLEGAISKTRIWEGKAEHTMATLGMDVLRDLEQRAKSPNGLVGVPTGMTDLDRKTGGWQKTDLVIVAARPGMGKTAFAICCALNAARDFQKPVGIFSLEMSAEQLKKRLISVEAEIDGEKLRSGGLTDKEWQAIGAAVEHQNGIPLYIDDTGAIDLFELRSKARRWKKKHGIELLIIDYLQLVTLTSDASYGKNREQQVSMISASLKALAKELKIPIIALSQLSRAVEVRGGSKRPQLSDLRESGSIEQEADIVAFLYRPEYYKILEDENGNSLKGVAEVLLEKNRHGKPEAIRVRFVEQFAQFADLDHVPVSNQFPATPPPFSPALPGGTGRNEDLPF